MRLTHEPSCPEPVDHGAEFRETASRTATTRRSCPHVARRPAVPAGRRGHPPPGRRTRPLPGDRAAAGARGDVATAASGRLPRGRPSAHRRGPGRAAWLWAGEDAAVCGVAAAYWHRLLDRAPTQIGLTVPSRCHPRRRPGSRALRRDLHQTDLTRTRGVRLTALPLTVLETASGAAERVDLPGPGAAAPRPLPPRLPGLLPQHGPEGVVRCGPPARRRGGPCRLGRRTPAGAHPARRRHQGWVLGHPFGPWRIDLAFLREKVAVEVDGWAWHVDAERFRTDRRKQNALVRAGGTRCDSPGTTSTAGRTRSRPRYARPSRRPPDRARGRPVDRRVRDIRLMGEPHVPNPTITPATSRRGPRRPPRCRDSCAPRGRTRPRR